MNPDAAPVLTLDELATLPLDRVVMSAAFSAVPGMLAPVGALDAKLRAAAACSSVAVVGVAAAQETAARDELAKLSVDGLQVVGAATLPQMVASLAREAVPAVFGEQPQEVQLDSSSQDWVDAWPEWTQWLSKRLSSAADGGTVTLLVSGTGVGKTAWAREWIRASQLCLAGSRLVEHAWAGLPALTSWLCVSDLRWDADRDGLRAMRTLMARARRRWQRSQLMQSADGSVHDLWLGAWQTLAAGPDRPGVWLIDGVDDMGDAWVNAIPRPPKGVHLVLVGRPATALGRLLRGSRTDEWAETVDLATRPEWLKGGVQRYLAHWANQLTRDPELAQTLSARQPALERLAQGQLARLAALRAHVQALPVQQQVPCVVNVNEDDAWLAASAGSLEALAPALLRRLQAAALAPTELSELSVVVRGVLGEAPSTDSADLAPYLDRSGSTVAQPWRGQVLKELPPRMKELLHARWATWCRALAEDDPARCWWAWHALQANPAEATEDLLRPEWWQDTFFQLKARGQRERLRAARATTALWCSSARLARLTVASAEHRRLWAQRLDRWGSALIHGHLGAADCWPATPQAGWILQEQRMLASVADGPDRWLLSAPLRGGVGLHRLHADSLVQVQEAAELPVPEGWCLDMQSPSALVWIDGNLVRASAVLQQEGVSGARALAVWSAGRDGGAGLPALHPLPQRGTPVHGVVTASAVMQVMGEPAGLRVWFHRTGSAREVAPALVPWPVSFDLGRVTLAAASDASGALVVVAADAKGRLWACTAQDPVAASLWYGPWAGSADAPLTALALVCSRSGHDFALVAWASGHEVRWGRLRAAEGHFNVAAAPSVDGSTHSVTALAAAEAPGGGWLLAFGDRSGAVHCGCGLPETGQAMVLKQVAASPRAAEAVAGGEDHAVVELRLLRRGDHAAPGDGQAPVTTWVARRADGDLAWGAWVGDRHDPSQLGRTAPGGALAGPLQVADQPGLDAPLVLVNRLAAAHPAIAWVSAERADGPLPPEQRGSARARLDRDALVWACASASDGQNTVALVGFSKQPLYVQMSGAAGTRPIRHATWNRSEPLAASAIADSWGWLVGSMNGSRQVDLSWSYQGQVGQAQLGLVQLGPQAEPPAMAISVGADMRIHLWLITKAGKVFTYSRTFTEPLGDGAFWRPQPKAHARQGVSQLHVWRHATPDDPFVDWVMLTDVPMICSGQWRLSQQDDQEPGSEGIGSWAFEAGAPAEQLVPAYSASGRLAGLAWRTAQGRACFVGRTGMGEASRGNSPLTTVQALDDALGAIADLAASTPQQPDEAPVFWARGATGEAVARLTQPDGAWRLQRLHLVAQTQGGSSRLTAANAASVQLVYTQGPDAGLVSTPVT